MDYNCLLFMRSSVGDSASMVGVVYMCYPDPHWEVSHGTARVKLHSSKNSSALFDSGCLPRPFLRCGEAHMQLPGRNHSLTLLDCSRLLVVFALCCLRFHDSYSGQAGLVGKLHDFIHIDSKKLFLVGFLPAQVWPFAQATVTPLMFGKESCPCAPAEMIRWLATECDGGRSVLLGCQRDFCTAALG